MSTMYATTSTFARIHLVQIGPQRDRVLTVCGRMWEHGIRYQWGNVKAVFSMDMVRWRVLSAVTCQKCASLFPIQKGLVIPDSREFHDDNVMRFSSQRTDFAGQPIVLVGLEDGGEWVSKVSEIATQHGRDVFTVVDAVTEPIHDHPLSAQHHYAAWLDLVSAKAACICAWLPKEAEPYAAATTIALSTLIHGNPEAYLVGGLASDHPQRELILHLAELQSHVPGAAKLFNQADNLEHFLSRVTQAVSSVNLHAIQIPIPLAKR